MIADELAEAGVEMVRPDLMFERLTRSEVVRSTSIASARVHVERRIARIKMFKIFSEKVNASIIPYIDDILIVLCGLSNISPPILNDQRFA